MIRSFGQPWYSKEKWGIKESKLNHAKKLIFFRAQYIRAFSGITI